MDKGNITSKLIKEELHFLISSMISSFESLDCKAAFEVFHNSVDFIMMGTDGTICGYDSYVKNNLSYFDLCEDFKLKTFNKEVRVIDDNTAVYSWAYGVNAKLKSGETDVIDHAGASFLFHRINSNWKVVYYHESTVEWRRIENQE